MALALLFYFVLILFWFILFRGGFIPSLFFLPTHSLTFLSVQLSCT
nr:MAG TPA: hypothetical protein [Caudoviricetes sp.]